MTHFFKTCALACVMSLSVATMSAQAATPSDASLVKLMQITKAAEQIKQMTSPDAGMMEQMVQGSLKGIPDSEISPNQRQQLGKIINKYNRQVFDEAYVKQMTEQMTKAYIASAKKHFTQEEVDAQIAFYGSPVGQNIINKQPAMVQDYMNSVMPEVMESTMKRMQEVMPKMQAEIAALKKSAK